MEAAAKVKESASTPQELARQVKETEQAMLKGGEERTRIGHSAQENRVVSRKDDTTKQRDKVTPRERDTKEAEIEREIWAGEAGAIEREAAQARAGTYSHRIKLGL